MTLTSAVLLRWEKSKSGWRERKRGCGRSSGDAEHGEPLESCCKGEQRDGV